MQRIIRVTLAACLLLTAAAALAQEPKPAPESTKPQAAPKPGAGQHVERAGSELKQAGEVASDDAREAMRVARERASESVREAREGANSALEQARKQAETSAEDAEEAAQQAGEKARTGMEKARVKALSFFETAREHVREALLSAAESLESEERKQERDKTRVQRQEAARTAQWQALRQEMDTTDATAQAAVDPTLSAELRVHAQRTARLARIRALAVQAKDTRTVERCDALLGKELARHEQHMTSLLKKADVNTQGQAREEVKP